MKHTLFTLTVVATMMLAASRTAFAHHSHAMFDMTREVTVTGTVTNFSFRNPHVFLYLDVKGPDGQMTNWAIEMSYVGNMESRGIYLSTFKPGDTVTVSVNPLRDGRHGGNYTSVTAADGKKYD
jgi:hypothetical protein